MDSLRQALFVTAIVAGCDKLDYLARGRLISRATSCSYDENVETTDRLTVAAQDIGVPASLIPSLRPRLREKTLALSEEWLAAGIQVVRSEELSRSRRMDDSPAVLFARGDPTLLERPRATILSSRQSPSVRPGEEWIASIKCMVDYAMTRQLTVVSSIGTLPYSLTCRAVRGSPVVVICDNVLPFMLPGAGCSEFLNRTAGLFDLERTLFLSPFAPGKLPLRRHRMALRDRLVATCASVILAADIRPDGNMQEILEDAAQSNVNIYGPVRDGTAAVQARPMPLSEIVHTTGLRPSRRPSRPRCRMGRVEKVGCAALGTANAGRNQHERETRLLATYLGRGFLIHYTRRCPGPWPGQTLGEYCQTLLDGSTECGHTALDTLNRILDERVIRGSERLVRGKRPIASFTECLPQELSSLVSWRKGLIRWSFEPYGIAVRKSTLVDRGARRVIYGGEEVFGKLPDPDKPFFQPVNPNGHDWSVEKEWRVTGDLDLSQVPRSHLVVIVPTLQEALEIANRHHTLVTWGGASTLEAQ